MGAATAESDDGLLVPVLQGLAIQVQASEWQDDDRSACRLGQALHRFLEWASGAGAAQHRADLARAAAAEMKLSLADDIRVLEMGSKTLESPALQRFFDPTGLAWAGNEVSVSWEGECSRIDRLVCLRAGGLPQW